MDVGRMAVITDPTGAPVALWQARNHAVLSVLWVVEVVTWAVLKALRKAVGKAVGKTPPSPLHFWWS